MQHRGNGDQPIVVGVPEVLVYHHIVIARRKAGYDRIGLLTGKTAELVVQPADKNRLPRHPCNFRIVHRRELKVRADEGQKQKKWQQDRHDDDNGKQLQNLRQKRFDRRDRRALQPAGDRSVDDGRDGVRSLRHLGGCGKASVLLIAQLPSPPGGLRLWPMGGRCGPFLPPFGGAPCGAPFLPGLGAGPAL